MKRWKKGVLIGIFSSLLFDQQAVEAAVSISKPDALTGRAVTPPFAGDYSLGSSLYTRSATNSQKVPTQVALVTDMNDLDNANEINHAPPQSERMQTAFLRPDEATSLHLLLAEQKEIAANPVLAVLQKEPLLASRDDFPPALNERIVESAEAVQKQTLSATPNATQDANSADAQATQISPSQTQVTQTPPETTQNPSTQPTPKISTLQTTQTQPQQQQTQTQEKAQTNVTSNSAPTMLASSGATATRGGRLVSIAKQFLGDPYCYGGTSPSGFDCSGFTQFVYRQAGIDLPRTTYSQVNAGTPVSKQNLQPGDLVFFACSGQATSHCGLYIGNGKFIHADLTRGIAIADLNSPYWSGVYQTAVRVQ